MTLHMLFRFMAVTVCVASAAWASSTVAVKSLTGTATEQLAGQGDWKPVHVGTILKQGDRLRTAEESQVSLEFSDGSQVIVEENTEAGIKVLLQNQSTRNTTLELPSGKLSFNIHKLIGANSNFDFEMKSATAAIRGTEGEVQADSEKAFASLVSGKLEMSAKDGKSTIVAGQLVLHENSGFKVMDKPKDTKDYQALVHKLMADSSAKERRENKRDRVHNENHADSLNSVGKDNSARNAERKPLLQKRLQDHPGLDPDRGTR